MLDSDFREARAILKKLQDHGHKAYIVGGAVRDSTLGKATEDVDIATSAAPEEVRSLFTKTIPVGLEHGTVVVRHKHRSYEVTTFRRESDYEDHRRPSSVSFVSSLHEDLGRRDFTMNAMAMSLDGDIIDPYGGREDIKDGIIRTVGKACERFREDPLRMMRAVRFTSQLSFRIGSETLQALKQSANDLQHISVERIRDEFEKLLMGHDTQQAVIILADTGLHACLPGLAGNENGLRKAADFEFGLLPELHERWALVCFILREFEPSSWLRKWKLSNHSISTVTNIIEALNLMIKDDFTRYSLYKAGLHTSRSAARLYALVRGEEDKRYLNGLEEAFNRLPIKQRGELDLTGNDLIDWFGQKPGPWVSKGLQEAEEAVIAGEVSNEKGTIRTWMLKRNHRAGHLS